MEGNDAVIGSYHKTGSVLISNVFRLYQQEDPSFTYIDTNHFNNTPDKVISSNKCVVIIRHPYEIIMSGMRYHQKPVEFWLSIPNKRLAVPVKGGQELHECCYVEMMASMKSTDDKIHFEIMHCPNGASWIPTVRSTPVYVRTYAQWSSKAVYKWARRTTSRGNTLLDMYDDIKNRNFNDNVLFIKLESLYRDQSVQTVCNRIANHLDCNIQVGLLIEAFRTALKEDYHRTNPKNEYTFPEYFKKAHYRQMKQTYPSDMLTVFGYQEIVIDTNDKESLAKHIADCENARGGPGKKIYGYTEMSNRRIKAIIGSYHKTGSVIFSDIFKTYQQHDKSFIYADYNHFNSVPDDAISKKKCVVLIRHPYEMIMSGMRYHQIADEGWCTTDTGRLPVIRKDSQKGWKRFGQRNFNGAPPKGELGKCSYKEYINSLKTRDEKIMFELHNCPNGSQWLPTSSGHTALTRGNTILDMYNDARYRNFNKNVLLIKLEDLQDGSNIPEMCESIAQHLACGINVRALIRSFQSVLSKNSFHRTSKGPGHTFPHHFKPLHYQRIKKIYPPDLLPVLGYAPRHSTTSLSPSQADRRYAPTSGTARRLFDGVSPSFAPSRQNGLKSYSSGLPSAPPAPISFGSRRPQPSAPPLPVLGEAVGSGQKPTEVPTIKPEDCLFDALKVIEREILIRSKVDRENPIYREKLDKINNLREVRSGDHRTVSNGGLGDEAEEHGVEKG